MTRFFLEDPRASLERLGLPPDADARAVKRAYAARLKRIDPAQAPEQFAQLRHDYELALAFAQQMQDEAEEDEPIAMLSSKASDSESHGEPPPADSAKPPEDIDIPAEPELEPSAFREDMDAPAPASTPPSAPVSPEEDAPFVEDHDAPEELLEELRLALHGPTDDIAAAQQRLRNVTTSPRLVGLAQREHFEILMIHALWQRQFGAHNGAMLLAAASVFGWNQNNQLTLMRTGPAGYRISQALDEASTLSPQNIAHLLALADEPSHKAALRLVCHPFKSDTPLCSLVLPPGHLERWMEVYQNVPRLAKDGYAFKSWWRRSWRTMAYKTAGILLFPVAIVIFGFISSQIRGVESRNFTSECSALYAKLKDQQWHDVSFSNINQLQKCVAKQPPEYCKDREISIVILEKAKKLLDINSSYYPTDIFFNLGDGREFGFLNSPTECNYQLNDFLTKSKWLASGDQRSIEALINYTGYCRLKTMTVLSPGLIEFLRHTDAWPSDDPWAAKTRIPITEFMGTPLPIDSSKLFPDSGSSPACIP